MRRWTALMSAGLALTLLAATPVAAAERRAVIDGAMLSIDFGSSRRQIDLGDPAARLPRFSSDGRQLALIGSGRDPGDLLVYSLDTCHIRRLPLNPDGNPVGMRFAEKLVWFGKTRVAVSGSVNPSLVETVILDLIQGRVVERIFSDAHGVSFSDDGTSFAYFDGMPHFTPESSWRPTLKVNHHTVYRLTDRTTRFAEPPRFLKNGQGLDVRLDRNSRSGLRLTLTRSGNVWKSRIVRIADRVSPGESRNAEELQGDPLSAVWTDRR